MISELNRKGILPDKIKIIVATGLHEIRFDKDVDKIVGKDICYHYNVVYHNSEENLIRLRTSSYGNPLIFNKKAVEADLRILTGSIEPHQLAGFTGEAKSLLPGSSSKENN